MGVHGLWKLIESTGQPVPLESLENKVLAIDVSIWLHKAIKGFQDVKGAQIPNAHLLSIYHRVCKLLYFKVKPVFVFDGGVPVLKKETIAKRNQQKSRNRNEADRIHKNLLNNLLKHTAVSKVLSEQTKAAIAVPTTTKSNDKADLYFLPPLPPLLPPSSSSSSSDEESIIEQPSRRKPTKQWDLHSIDPNSQEFKSLPIEVRHEILTDLKETRKQSSWGRIHELPTISDDFSVYQMKRLLKRQNVQNALEEIEKEMGGHQLSLGELEQLLTDQGVLETGGNRIASDENTRFVLIKNLKQAIEDAKQKDAIIEEDEDNNENLGNKAEMEFRNDLQTAIALSLQDQPSTSGQNRGNSRELQQTEEKTAFSFVENSDEFITESSEEEDGGGSEVAKLKSAQNYMMEYSGLTPSEIAKIMNATSGKSKRIEEKVTKNGRKTTKSNIEANGKISVITEDFEGECRIENSPNHAEKSPILKTVPEETESSVISNLKENCEKFEENSPKHEENVEKPQISEEKPITSESSDDDDDEFVDVEEATKTPTKNEKIMEVVIKPDEAIDDDLFSDIFTNDAPQQNHKVYEIEESIEIGKKPEEKPKTLKDKLEKWIQQYTEPTKPTKSKDKDSGLSVEKLQEIRENLQKEQRDMIVEKSAKERLATDLTDQIYQETQELLELFGVPYIVAPMEAEAQCAFLDQINLVDGTITDDSDIWLFGGKTVYKNFFNNDKTVLEFRAENIQHHFKLTRHQMVLLALLVGSDYTIGLPGIGPVTALEVLATFPPKKPTTEFTLTQYELITGLKEFRQWCETGKLAGRAGRTSLRNKLKNLELHRGFPNVNVIQAYLEPTVETSDEKFTWSKPDIVGLCDFAKRKFGWTLHKSQEILKPIIKRMNDNKKQLKLLDYYQIKSKPEQIEQKLSKRVQTAINRLNKSEDDEDNRPEQAAEPKQKRVRKKKTEVDNIETQNAVKRPRKQKDYKDEDVVELGKVERISRKRAKQIENEMSEKQAELEEKQSKPCSSQNKREIIPQKQRDRTDMLKNKLKAIEVFRKSKRGPGFVKKTTKKRRLPKEDAGLSESSCSD